MLGVKRRTEYLGKMSMPFAGMKGKGVKKSGKITNYRYITGT